MPVTVPSQPVLIQPSVAADLAERSNASKRGAPTCPGVLLRAGPGAIAWCGIYADLFKARLTSLVLLTTLVGFYVGLRGPIDYALLCHLMLGTALVASGASALNQFMERELDAKMRRTQGRPLPANRLQPQTVLLVGGACAVVGLLYLARAVNLTTSLIGAITLGSYLFVYTPLKRVTWFNTIVGAVPGALPPLMGWTAACGGLSGKGLALFFIQACWQVPHFMAIAWIYRHEYAKAGFQMLPAVDPQGLRTSRLALLFTGALLPVSLWPTWGHLAGMIYAVGALVLGLAFVWFAFLFALATRRHPAADPAAGDPSLADRRAWQLFYLSLLYLPLLMTVMVLDKIK